jgi:hypothetical protein
MDNTCFEIADDISCDAMTILAKDEYSKNLQSMSYNLINPACDRMQKLADRGVEYDLQKRPGTHLNDACFNLPANYYNGPWVSQFNINKPPFDTKFDKWTRPK